MMLIKKLFIVSCFAIIWCSLSSQIKADESNYEKSLQAFYDSKYDHAYSLLKKSEVSDDFSKSIYEAVIHLKKHEPDLALTKLKQVKTVLPDERIYWLYLFFKISLLKGNVDSARDYMLKIETDYANQFIARLVQFELANYYFDKKVYIFARDYYLSIYKNAAIEHDIYVETVKRLIKIALYAKDKPSALKYYQTLVTYFPSYLANKKIWASISHQFGPKLARVDALTDIDQFALMCQKLVKYNKYKTAAKYSKLFILRYPQYKNIGDIYTALGVSYYYQFEFGRAIRYLGIVTAQHQNSTSYVKALFYLGRSYQRSKNNRKANKIYTKLILDYYDKSFSPMAHYYNYYATKRAKPKFNKLTYLRHFKSAFPKSKHYNLLIWEIGWNRIKNRKWQSAINVLKLMSTASVDISRQAEITYWHAKSYRYLGNKTKGNTLFNQCLQSYPFSFYAYRIISRYMPNKKISTYIDKLSLGTIQPDDKADWLLHVGLGELAARELQYQMDRSDPLTDKEIYSLAYIYNYMKQYYQSIAVIRKSFNLKKYPHQDTEIPKEYIKLLYPQAHQNVVAQYAKRFKIDAVLVTALMREESMFHHTIQSRAKAVGLMQLMPYTAKEISRQLRERWKGNKSLHNIHINIRYGVYYLSRLKRRFNSDKVLMLAAYNAGPKKAKKWTREFKQKDPDLFISYIPFKETRYYVQRVLESYWIYQVLY